MESVPQYLTAKEIAGLLRVSIRTVQRMTANGELPHICVRGHKRYPATAIQRLIAGGRADA